MPEECPHWLTEATPYRLSDGGERIGAAAGGSTPTAEGPRSGTSKGDAQVTQLPLANTITLGVRDFDRQRRFYAALGWPQAFEADDFAVFELRGAVLALFPVEKLGADSRAAPETGRGGIRFSIIITVDTPPEVDDLVERAIRAGARVTKPPVDAEFFEGRDAYFADPEDNYWEVAWVASVNPVISAARRAAGLDG